MKSKDQERSIAIGLRQKGSSYNDILRKVKVAKSTLSFWLKNLPLNKEERRFLRSRIDDNISRGRIRAGTVIRKNRINREKIVFVEAKEEFIKQINEDNRTFFCSGVALYWAEGSKRSNCFEFTNSDPTMVRFMVQWIEKFLKVPESSIELRMYIHKAYAHEDLESFWIKTTGLSPSNFRPSVYKTKMLNGKKRPNYKGCLRIRIGKKVLLLKMLAWKEFLAESCSSR
jgi:hypothetical protein